MYNYSYILQSIINKIKNKLKVKTSNLNSTAHLQADGGNITAMSYQSGINSGSFNTVNSSVFHKLPKFNLPVFSGNILQWQAFWNSYNLAIHTNQSLTDVQRLII
jgi:hypothetical protein